MSADAPNVEPPRELRELIARDLRPVRPLASPWLRATVLLPLALIVLAGIPWILGMRNDALTLGAGMSWGISALQVLAGIALVGLALEESVPGHALSARVLFTSIATAIVIIIVVTATTFAASPSVAPGPMRGTFFKFCFRYSVLAGAPVVLAAGFLAARALPLRPWAAGALYGLGAGLITDAGWRLFCEVSAPGHVLAAHGAAILSLTLLGALAAEATERMRWSGRVGR